MLKVIEWLCNLTDEIDRRTSEWAVQSTSRRFLVFMTWMIAYFGVGGCAFASLVMLIYMVTVGSCTG